ncbi:alkyl sulfatase dimerization domain-containing protein [Novosphingobium sp.]|uniref:alkyl/aryl-sulfatase n=1 Tax=Novosphingobium sp. TaxID=1874826 RepID=UPI0025DB717E|nr:alkyl sulfatase dimerization domain-containing protein [Novosphingobium sp.]
MNHTKLGVVLLPAVAILLASSAPLAAQNTATVAPPPADPALSSKPASAATIAAQKAAAASLPAEDGRDAEFAARGFVASRADPLIRNADGRPVWNLAAYDWVKGAAPVSVNPSLWREVSVLSRHGLFKVADGVWQVRGFDVSNMTVIAGKSGWILVDPLTTKETAAAALELVNGTLGRRPVSAAIYSHSHADHFGGVRGVIDEADVAAGKVMVVAPAHFVEEAASENVLAGGAMGRRSVFQFGGGLTPGVQGQMGSGIGMAVSGGSITLIAPTQTIERTGETRLIDGVAMEFQIVSGSEAPSELNLYLPAQKVFLSAEMSTCSLHNILTPRGAKVRDTRAWAGYLDEALRLYGSRAEVDISSHCWPRFGQGEVARMLASQRDNYRFLHDQTVRLMNRGENPAEIAEALVQPPALAADWFIHGYYGTYSHNSKAIYQYYLGWYDAVPANLDPWPPAERAKRMVAAIGGGEKVLAQARAAMAAGDYRWSSDLLQNLVFADPTNRPARAALADSYEQQGYQAESGIWRNQFLVAANELRHGRTQSNASQSADLVAAVPTQLLLDSAATRFDPAKLGGRRLAIDLVMPERYETAGIDLTGTAMIARMVPASAPAATITAPRRALLGLIFLKLPLATAEKMGAKVEGDRAAIEAWLAALDPIPGAFNIIEP